MALLAGWTADRFGSKRTIGGVLLLTGVMTVLLGIVPGYWIVVIIFVQPMLAVSFFPPGFAVLSAVSPQSSRNVVVSLTIPVAFLVGGGAIPTMIGIMGDAGSFAGGIAIAGSLILIGFILSFYLKIPASKNP
jgi:NNP family nitrate/nitrite transporter-like MFS transporter